VEHFSDRLRHARKLRKLSQAALARASGLSQGAISSYENRTRQATTGLIELARALGVNPLWLHTGQGPMEATVTLAAPSKATISEQMPAQARDGWPFASLPPEDYWALAQPQRQIVEETVAALIAALRMQGGGK